MTNPRPISVFIASPSDLAPERKVFREIIETLNLGFADGAGVRFTADGWEEVLAETGRRAQSTINLQIEKADLFVLVLRRRWGQPAQDSPASSYTEEEFNLALESWKVKRKPEILVFFKQVDSDSLADPGEELKKVLNFRNKLEASKTVLYRSFNTERDFAEEIDKHLRAFARGEWGRLGEPQQRVSFPGREAETLNEARRKTRQTISAGTSEKHSNKKRGRRSAFTPDLTLARKREADLTLAIAAIEAARTQRPQQAGILFAKATESTVDVNILSVAADFYAQINDLQSAGRLVRRIAALSKDARVAARYYLELMPADYMVSASNQVIALREDMAPEMAEEIAGVLADVYRAPKFRDQLLELLARVYTEEELISMTEFTASPVGQACLQKYNDFLREMYSVLKSEITEVFEHRYPMRDELPPESDHQVSTETVS